MPTETLTPLFDPFETLTPTPSPSETFTPIFVPTETFTPTSSPSYTPTSTPTQAVQPYGVAGNWVLVFSDEFQGTSLDTSKWYTCFPWSGTVCDNTPNTNLWYIPENVSVSNGIARLTARKQTYNGRPYTTGMISSINPSNNSVNDFQYGFMEARIKVPVGSGFWPAFWTVGTYDWPPELDIFEMRGTYQNAPITQAYGWGSNGVITWTPVQYYQVTDPNFYNNYHVYSVDWEPGVINWYIDGVKTRTWTSSNVTTMRMFVLITLQLGGQSAGMPTPLDSELPAYMDIDYVRVWQKAP
jgi:beta-glucanase (GH16 family)